jgi:hypothetical protein
MILLTVMPIPNGYRLIAATRSDVAWYRWTFYRDDNRLSPTYRAGWPTNVVIVDLPQPVVPGVYRVHVDHFQFPFDQSFNHPQTQYQSQPILLPLI